MSSSPDDPRKKIFCPLLWNHAFVNQNGAHQVCCTSEEFDNNIRDENGQIMTIDTGHNPDQVMNSKYMKDLRLKLLNGEWPEICRRCEMTEKMNGASRRMVELMHYEEQVDQMLASTAVDGTISLKATSADYRLGNLCNLQCRMCNPRSTKLWIKDWNSIKDTPEKFSEDVLQSYQKYDWIDSDNLIRDFEEKAPFLEQIHFAGGEPLLVPQMGKILERFIAAGTAKNITITYNTNLTVLPERVLNLWKHFKAIKILASVDAVGSLNNYIRFPGKWDQVDKNLKFIDEHHLEFNIQECMLSTTVQALNILDLSELYKYLEQFNFIIKAPNLINLHFPFYMQTTVLPQNLKALAESLIFEATKDLKEKLSPQYLYLADNIVPTLRFMHSSNGYETGLFDKLVKFLKDFDQLKNLDFEKNCPEIAMIARSREKAQDKVT